MDPECTSDQESDPDGPGFLIMHKRARNPHVTDFLRAIDKRRQQGTPLFRGQRRNTRREEPRTPHPHKQESRISERLPRNCPLDWFDPIFFNNMDVSFRALYLEAPIALPLPQNCAHLDPPPDWKTMSEASFMEKYGAAVLAKYNLPTEEELTALYDGQEDTDNQVTPRPSPPLQESEGLMEQ
jgi:hypothetical protein